MLASTRSFGRPVRARWMAGVEALEVDHRAVDHVLQAVPRRVGHEPFESTKQVRWCSAGLALIVENSARHERRLLRRLAARHRDAADERRGAAYLREQVVDAAVHGVVPLDRRVTGDRLRVVARDAVEVAALQEDDEPVARSVDVAERDRVGDERPRAPVGARSTWWNRSGCTTVASSTVALMASDALHRSLGQVIGVLAARRRGGRWCGGRRRARRSRRDRSCARGSR